MTTQQLHLHTIAHIINPFQASKDSDLYTAQPITFESMIRAKESAKSKVNIELWSAAFAGDDQHLSLEFKRTSPLERSTLDVPMLSQYPMKLPFIKDILARLFEASHADYFIYTNVDIGLYPTFYQRVNDLINEGYDALIINRRRLSEKYTAVLDLEQIYSDYGKSHPGYDCFVFSREILQRFVLEGICIGVPFIGITMAQNIFCFSHRYKILTRENQTFHIGMEIFKKRAPKPYFNYNRQEFWKAAAKMKYAHHARKLPFSHQPLFLRLLKYGIHPSIPIRWVLQLEYLKYFKRH
ncbi:MAG: hypothetical protein ABNH00_12245 [Dokdonia sp.]